MKKQYKPSRRRKLFSILTTMMLIVNSIGIGAFANGESQVVNTSTDAFEFASADKSAAHLGGDEFEVTLTVEGKDKETTTPLEIVFVLDTSGSMSKNKDKLTVAKKAIKDFMDILLPDGTINSQVKFGLVTYADNVGTVIPLTDDKATIQTTINGLTAGGGTYTQAGLKKAAELISPGPNKHIILLSDGAPTYSSEVLTLGTTSDPIAKHGIVTSSPSYSGDYGDKVAATFGNRVGSGDNFKYNKTLTISPTVYGYDWVKHGNPSVQKPTYNGYVNERVPKWGGSYWRWEWSVLTPAVEFKVQDHGFATISYARQLKAAGHHIIGLGIELDSATSGINGVGSEGVMKAIASDYYSVSNVNTLAQAMKDIAYGLVASMNDGRLVDPITDCYELVGTPSVTTTGGATNPAVAYDSEGKTINVTGITLKAGQTMTLTYKLKMKESCQDGEFHPMNNTTTLYQNPEDNKGKNINVPEGMLPTPIPVQASIQLTKTANPSTYYYEGQVIEYTFVVKNTGNADLTSVVVTDDMLGTVREFGPLEAGSTETLYETYTITAADMEKSSILNTAKVTAYAQDQTQVEDEASATIHRGSDTGEIIVNKISATTELPLEGAVFRLYPAMSDGNDGYTPNREESIKKITDANGRIVFSGGDLEHNDNLFFHEDFVLFYLEEISAPAGFIRDSELKEIQMDKICTLEVPVDKPSENPPVEDDEGDNGAVAYGLGEGDLIITSQGDEGGPEAVDSANEGLEDETILAIDLEPEEETPATTQDPPDGEVEGDKEEGNTGEIEDETETSSGDDQANIEMQARAAMAPQVAAVDNGQPEQKFVCVEYLLVSRSITVANTPIVPDIPTTTGGGGGGGQSTVRPDPTPTVIPEEPVPLAPPETEIADEEVPLAPAEVEIEEVEIPLAAVPKTGIGYIDYSTLVQTNYILTVDAILQDKKRIPSSRTSL